MNKLSININLIKKIKKSFFPFYKDKYIQEIFTILQKDQPKEKKIAMFVGGCVRKYILNEEIDDIDIATIFTPEEIKYKFKDNDFKIIDTGVEHGTVTIMCKNYKFEITTLRKDVKTDGRHAEVAFTDDWHEDSSRRDFTINAIYLDIKGNFFDPQNGINDLKKNSIKFIGDPAQRISEDYLRIIRFIRFSLQYNNEKSEDITIEAIKLKLNGIKNLSKERVLFELIKILKLKNFNKIIFNSHLLDIFQIIFPELKYLKRLNKFNTFDNEESNFDKELILATLLVDETNNHEYFCHKYKASNYLKETLHSFAKFYKLFKNDKSYFKNNLKNDIYYSGKDMTKKYVIFSYLENENLKISYLNQNLNLLKKIHIPEFPFNGKYLMQKGFAEGKNIGDALKLLEDEWVKNDYFLSEKSIDAILSKKKN